MSINVLHKGDDNDDDDGDENNNNNLNVTYRKGKTLFLHFFHFSLL